MGGNFEIIFYRAEDGRCQACDYARALDGNHKAKASRLWRALAEVGPELPERYGKHLEEGIWELRVIVSHHQHRFLYFFVGNVVVVANGFLKKGWAVPDEEIERAKWARKRWLSRRSGEEK